MGYNPRRGIPCASMSRERCLCWGDSGAAYWRVVVHSVDRERREAKASRGGGCGRCADAQEMWDAATIRSFLLSSEA